MKILIVHNAYRTPGGEDTCVQNEYQALKAAGLDVRLLIVRTGSGPRASRDAMAAPFGLGEESRMESALEKHRPNILHAHNLYPLLSARLFKAAKLRHIKTVQTLHNFRPLCLNGLFLTPKLEICERCTFGHYSPGIIRGCYRKSRLQSAGLAAHLAAAQRQGWYGSIDIFIAPSRFLESKYERVPPFAGRIARQGHVIPEKIARPPEPAAPYVLYLGRLSPEKGVLWLCEQFQMPRGGIRLVIAGDGMLRDQIRQRVNPSIEYAGWVDGDRKNELISRATALVMPSECYENFPLAIAEAALMGVPSLVPDHGGLSERVVPGLNGERYRLRDRASFDDALSRLRTALSAPDKRHACQHHAVEEYSETRFVQRRLEIYNAA